jgi:PAS domain-containing protein
MIGQYSTELPQAGSRPNPSLPAGKDAIHDAHGTLILDRVGMILSCGVPAAAMFGAGQAKLIGRRISDFITGLFLDGSSPSFSARHLVYLCGSGEWRRFDAKDAAGQGFPVELKLSQMVTDGQEMVLLTLRSPNAMGRVDAGLGDR